MTITLEGAIFACLPDRSRSSTGRSLAAGILLSFLCGWAAIPAKGQACSFSVSTNAIDFGVRVPGAFYQQSFTITPTAMPPGGIAFQIRAGNQSPRAVFSTNPISRTSSTPFDVVVTFFVDANATNYTGAVTVSGTSGMTACGTQEIALSGQSVGIPCIQQVGSTTPPLVCDVTATEIDFGRVGIGDSRIESFTASSPVGPGVPVRMVVSSSHPGVTVSPGVFLTGAVTSRQVDISFQPTSVGPVSATIRVSASFADTNFPIPVGDVIEVSGEGFGVATTFLPDAAAGCAYDALVTAGGGVPPYGWSIASGSLPPGLTLNADTGAISGRPAKKGRTNFSVQVADDRGAVNIGILSITVRDPRKPTVAPEGFLDAAGFEQPPAVGGLASVFGTFCVESGDAGQIPLPIEINGLRLLLGPPGANALPSGENSAETALAPLLFVSEQQINFQVPWELASSAPGFLQAVVETKGIASDPVTLPIAGNTPSIFAFEFERPAKGVVLNLDNTAAQPHGAVPGYPSRPAQRGGIVVIYANGLGPVDPPGRTGALGLDDEGRVILRRTRETPVVRVGGIPAIVSFAGLSPNFIGLYQVNAALAQDTPLGDAIPIVIETGGTQSPADITIAVGPATLAATESTN